MIVLVTAILVLAVVALALVQSALQGVYSAALYRYATDGNVGESFSERAARRGVPAEALSAAGSGIHAAHGPQGDVGRALPA